jgi:hypothetical protein
MKVSQAAKSIERLGVILDGKQYTTTNFGTDRTATTERAAGESIDDWMKRHREALHGK